MFVPEGFGKAKLYLKITELYRPQRLAYVVEYNGNCLYTVGSSSILDVLFII